MHTAGEKIASAFCILHPANAMFWFIVRKCSYFVANTSAQLLLQLVMDVIRVMAYCSSCGAGYVTHECTQLFMRHYCTLGHEKITDVGTFSFRWILPFWYFCFIFEDTASPYLYVKRKQKYQNGNIHRKLRVPTSEREGKLSNPRARAPRARCMEKI